MMRLHWKHLWLVLAAYGVWFAILSGLEEASRGKYWKIIASLILGAVTYFLVETKIHE